MMGGWRAVCRRRGLGVTRGTEALALVVHVSGLLPSRDHRGAQLAWDCTCTHVRPCARAPIRLPTQRLLGTQPVPQQLAWTGVHCHAPGCAQAARHTDAISPLQSPRRRPIRRPRWTALPLSVTPCHGTPRRASAYLALPLHAPPATTPTASASRWFPSCRTRPLCPRPHPPSPPTSHIAPAGQQWGTFDESRAPPRGRASLPPRRQDTHPVAVPPRAAPPPEAPWPDAPNDQQQVWHGKQGRAPDRPTSSIPSQTTRPDVAATAPPWAAAASLR